MNKRQQRTWESGAWPQRLELRSTSCSDATAALGVVIKRGVGKTRHIDTQDPWLQNSKGNREFEVQFAAGKENVAGDEVDGCT